MKYCISILFLAIYIKETSFKITSSTLASKERIQILREVLRKEILEKRSTKSLYPHGAKDLLDDYEYVQNEKEPITPIIEINIKKSNKNFKLKTIKNKTTQNDSEKTAESTTDNVTTGLRAKGKRLRKKKRIHIKKPIETFYRRVYNTNILNERLEWVHCQDMIGPILTGAKTNISNPKRLSTKDTAVLRFVQLLNVNTSTYGRDDIYSILYQISKLQLRLFQWDVAPLNVLLNVIIKEKKHTFVNLKHGITDLFHNWRLDISNTSSLLKQTRIFRPPCVKVSTFDGSTKSPKITKYPKKGQTSTTKCDDDDDCNY